jgi:hypothetical protein
MALDLLSIQNLFVSQELSFANLMLEYNIEAQYGYTNILLKTRLRILNILLNYMTFLLSIASTPIGNLLQVSNIITYFLGNITQSGTITNNYGVFPQGNLIQINNITQFVNAYPNSATIPIVAGQSNPVEIQNYQQLYANVYGNNPTIIIQEITSTGVVKDRTDVEGIRTYSGPNLISLSFDFGTVPNGQIIIKL